MSRLLALDQSSRITGYAVFEDGKLIKYNKFELTNPNIDTRLFQLRNKILELLNDNQIDEVVLEDIQQQNNIQTFKALAEVYGVICELLEENSIKHSSALASSWKAALGIKGKSRTEQKKAAREYVLNNYNITDTQDVCDAICIGTYHLQKSINDWTE